MRIPRVRIPGAREGAEASLEPRDAQHVARVLRRGVGDTVEVQSGASSYSARIVSIEGEDVRVLVGSPLAPGDASGPRELPWLVGVALVKGSGMDVAVRMASELGLEGLVPIAAERSEVRASSGRPDRWERIAREAAKQCGRPEPLTVGAAQPLPEVIQSAGDGRSVFIASPVPSSEARGSPRLRADLDPSRPALVLVGPEGGWSPSELEAAERLGASPLALPTPVLRTPTAVVLVAALGVAARLQNSVDGGAGPR